MMMFPTTKFRPPRTARGSIRREEILTLIRTEQPSVVVLRGPAGYGKTTLATQLAASGGDEEHQAPIWATLEADDDDPAALWTAVAQSMIVAGVPADMSAQPPVAGSVRIARILPVLEALAAVKRPVMLVLDDVHLLSGEDVIASLDWFLSHAPENLTVVLATRAVLSLPAVDHLMARGRAMELTPDELRFEDEQIDRLLCEIVGGDLPDAVLRPVVQMTGGWPAAVRLVGSAIARGVPLERIVTQPIERGGLSSLIKEGLSAGAHDDEALLRGLSVFERFDADAVSAVLRDDRAWPLAMDVAERTGLIAALDDDGRWWRLHHLVRDQLSADLDREDPELRRKLHRRAFAHLESENDLALTIHHLLGAEDFATIADILANVRATAVVPSQAVGLGWLERIPIEVLRREPRLAFWEAWATATAGDRVRRERALARGRLAAAGNPVDAFRTWDDAEDFVLSMACFDDVGSALRAGERFLASYDPAIPLVPFVALRVSSMRYLSGDLEGALEILGWIERLGPLARPLRLFVPAYRALCLLEIGDVGAASDEVARTLDARRDFEIGADPVYLPADQALARLQTESGDAVSGMATAEIALEIAGQQGDSVLVVPHLLIEVARAQQALGDVDGAEVSLNRAEGLSAACVDAGALPDRIEALRLGHRRRRPSSDAVVGLSRRELEVLSALAGPQSAAEIAAELFISPNTARSHIKAIHRKLNASSRAEVVAAARLAGLLR